MPVADEEEDLYEDDIESGDILETAAAEEKEIADIDLEDPELAFAATKIQAGYRGMKTRKDTRQLKKEKAHEGSQDEGKFAEKIDIDLDDPDVEMAATKIQAGYKGMRTRKEIKQRREQINEDENKAEDNEVEGNEIDIFGKMTMEKKFLRSMHHLTLICPYLHSKIIPLSNVNGYFEDMMNFSIFFYILRKISNFL